MDTWLSSAQLLQRVPVGGRRPDAALKRLRRAGLIPRPRRQTLGKARGTRQVYPPGTEGRLRRILELRGAGIRAERELRWALWFEGDDAIWSRVQADLVAEYPTAEQAALEQLKRVDPEGILDKVDRAATNLADEWSQRRHPAYDRRRVRSRADSQTLAHVAISTAVGLEPPNLELRVEEGRETEGELVDRAWGAGSADVAKRLIAKRAADPSRWEDALRSATAAEARVIADLWKRAFEPAQLRRELSFFGRNWSDRALLVGSQLFAIQTGLAPP